MSEKNFFEVMKETAGECPDLLAEFGDLAIDSVFEGSVVERIPILGWVVALYDFQSNFQKKKLMRNVHAFLAAVADGDAESARNLFDELDSNVDRRDEFTEIILDVLIAGERPLKAEIVGNLLVALTNGDLTFEQFCSYSIRIYSASIPALEALDYLFTAIIPNDISSQLKISIDCRALLISSGFVVDTNSGLFPTNDAKNIHILGYRTKQADV